MAKEESYKKIHITGQKRSSERLFSLLGYTERSTAEILFYVEVIKKLRTEHRLLQNKYVQYYDIFYKLYTYTRMKENVIPVPFKYEILRNVSSVANCDAREGSIYARFKMEHKRLVNKKINYLLEEKIYKFLHKNEIAQRSTNSVSSCIIDGRCSHQRELSDRHYFSDLHITVEHLNDDISKRNRELEYPKREIVTYLEMWRQKSMLEKLMLSNKIRRVCGIGERKSPVLRLPD